MFRFVCLVLTRNLFEGSVLGQTVSEIIEGTNALRVCVYAILLVFEFHYLKHKPFYPALNKILSLLALMNNVYIELFVFQSTGSPKQYIIFQISCQAAIVLNHPHQFECCVTNFKAGVVKTIVLQTCKYLIGVKFTVVVIYVLFILQGIVCFIYDIWAENNMASWIFGFLGAPVVRLFENYEKEPEPENKSPEVILNEKLT